MSEILEKIRDLQVYKRLLSVFGEYAQEAPATGYNNLFDRLVSAGKSVVPKDPQALAILDYLLKQPSAAGAVHKLMNYRFSNLPVHLKPRMKKGRQHLVASWYKGGCVYDRVKALVDFDNVGGPSYWCDLEGNKVELIDMNYKEQD